MIGEKIESFYLSLRLDGSVEGVCDTLRSIETHDDIHDLNVLPDIIADCQKKASQFIRAHYAEEVGNIISTSRKKLNVKASLDNETSHLHSHRHLNTLVELLGTWSDIIASLSNYNLSMVMMYSTTSSLHSRIIDMAFDCFEKFKEDKSLHSWHSKVLDPSSEFSVIALDAILSQVVSMRDVVRQYHAFYAEHCDPPKTASNDHEFLRWRELDAIYSALECAYMSKASSIAMQDRSLLDLEENVLVLQLVEDCFFLFERVVERSMKTGSETSVMATSNRVVELLDPGQESQLFCLLVSGTTYRVACQSRPDLFSLNGEHATEQPLHTSRSDPSLKNAALNAVALADDASDSLINAAGEWLLGLGTPSQHITPRITTSTSRDTNGMNGNTPKLGLVSTPFTWLENLAIASGAVVTSTSESSMTSTGIGTGGLEYETGGRYGSPGANLMVGNTSTSATASTDLTTSSSSTLWATIAKCIQLNSLAVAVDAIASLADEITGAAISPGSSLSIIATELNRCQNLYRQQMQLIARDLLDSVIKCKVSISISKLFIDMSYDIDGDEMERRSGSSELIRWISMLVSNGSVLYRDLQPRLSSTAYFETIRQLATCVGDSLLEELLKVRFSEWGAMLMQEEVQQMIQLLENAVNTSADCIRSSFTSLLLALQLLTLDQPADILRYNIPIGVLDDDRIRAVMSRRIDFSLEAVSKVKFSGR